VSTRQCLAVRNHKEHVLLAQLGFVTHFTGENTSIGVVLREFWK
jgi:hypothetical protein